MSPNQFKNELLRNEAQLHFLSLRSPLNYGHGEGLSRVEMNALRAPLTAPPHAKGDLFVFSCLTGPTLS
jgi:hypothetical protein